MNLFIAALGLAALTASGPTHTDTTVSVQPGSRLELNNFAGDIGVHVWGKNAVRIEADHSSRFYIDIDHDGPTLSLRSRSRHGVPATIDYALTVPTWMAIDLSGVATDISVEGLKAAIKAQTVRGDINVQGGSGYISLGSVEGGITVTGARGKVEVNSVNEGIRVSDLVGELAAETVNGDIVLDAVDSKTVEANTINGEILYSGAIRDGGVYMLSTHNGDIVVAVPVHTSAAVQVSTFGGDFNSTFPVEIRDTRKGRRFTFTLGDGSARLELESFQGSIHLARPDQLPSKIKTMDVEKLREKLKEMKVMKIEKEKDSGSDDEDKEKEER